MNLGCARLKIRNPLPQELSAQAQVPGFHNVRMWGDKSAVDLGDWYKLSPAELKTKYPALYRTPHNYLAISGGGANGAFGAGLLLGWTERGDRPEFSMVTGISTGALMSPFAFLGSEYDDRLREIYTTLSTKDILEERFILKILTGDSAVSSTPLKKTIARYIDQEIMEAIAAEHRRGRRLYVGTANLDAGRPVIWDIGAIAGSGDPKALDLIRDVLLASASIPGIFPPVFINVEANGVQYDEIHVDGGTASQVFLYPTGIDWSKVLEKFEVGDSAKAYIIRNSYQEAQWETVKPKISPIAGRTIDSLIRTQGLGDIHRIYLNSRAEAIDFNLTFIPEEFTLKAKEPFDKEYMNQLFNLGYKMGNSGYPWKKFPPGFVPPK